MFFFLGKNKSLTYTKWKEKLIFCILDKTQDDKYSKLNENMHLLNLMCS